jgi:hypothetical protein
MVLLMAGVKVGWLVEEWVDLMVVTKDIPSVVMLGVYWVDLMGDM